MIRRAIFSVLLVVEAFALGVSMVVRGHFDPIGDGQPGVPTGEFALWLVLAIALTLPAVLWPHLLPVSWRELRGQWAGERDAWREMRAEARARRRA